MNSYDDTLTGIRLLTKNKQPTIDLAALLYRHNCLYLLARLQGDHTYTAVYKAEFVLNQICIQQRYTACRRIFDLFQRLGTPYAVVKGAVLSQAAYDDIR